MSVEMENARMKRIDLRRVRADQAVSAILRTLERYIPDACRNEAIQELYDKMVDAGAELVTDVHRREYGLPERGPDGWTAEEIILMEQRKLNMLTEA